MATVPATLKVTRSAPRISLETGGAIVLALRLAAAAAMLGLNVVLARALDVSGYGVYVFAMAWMQAMAVFGRAGLENTSLRQIAEHRVRDETALLSGFLAWSRRRSLLASCLSAVVLVVLTLAFIAPITPATRSALLLGAAAIPLLTVRQIQEARLRAVHHVWQSLIGPALWPTLMLVLLLIAIFLGGWTLTASGAIAFQIAALAICSLVTLMFIRRSPLAEVASGITDTQVHLWRRTSLAFLAFDAVILLRGRTSIVIAGMLIDTDTAGIYAAAERFAEVVTLGVVSINMFAAPHFAALHASGQRAELRRLVRSSRALGLMFAVPMALALVIFGRPLLGLLHEGFIDGYPLLLIMLLSVTVGSFAGPAAYVLAMSGHERITLHGAIVCMVVNLVLSFALTPIYGAMGLAVTHLVTMSVWTAYMLWHMSRYLRAQ